MDDTPPSQLVTTRACCGSPKECERPCVPRGRWQALQGMQEVALRLTTPSGKFEYRTLPYTPDSWELRECAIETLLLPPVEMRRNHADRWVTQTRLHDDGTKGNCTEAAIASLLGIPLSDVPDLHAGSDDPLYFWDAFEAFFARRGLLPLRLNGNVVPDVLYLASGKTERGTNHMVVMQAGGLVHDPHPSRAGLLRVDHIWLILPRDMSVLVGAQQVCNAVVRDPRATAMLEFQRAVGEWLVECFGEQIATDRAERNHRFIEEALELAQACGATREHCHQLVDYVFGRPVGEPLQEVGGTMVTLAALCFANGLSMTAGGGAELERICQPEVMRKIRAKQARKPKLSPLPGRTDE